MKKKKKEKKKKKKKRKRKRKPPYTSASLKVGHWTSTQMGNQPQCQSCREVLWRRSKKRKCDRKAMPQPPQRSLQERGRLSCTS